MPREDEKKDAKSVMTLKTKIAILLLQEGEIKKAQAAFTQLEEEADAADVFDDQNLEIARWRGVSFDKLGEYLKALEKLQKTLSQINDLTAGAYRTPLQSTKLQS
jgi:tetratricopeptide (TPR) repeat protein